MKKIIGMLVWILLCAVSIQAQELYVFSDPASNLPAKSLSAKLTARFADLPAQSAVKQRYMPELMYGLSKSLMLRASTTVSDFYSDNLRWESAKLYLKWRFLSRDGIHNHFRMAAFADGSYSRNKSMVYDEMNLDGDNSGLQAGIIATQLIHKLAVSATASAMKITGNYDLHQGMGIDRSALAYSLSAGYLLFPRSYENYDQVNLNLYLELLGMKGMEEGRFYNDLAPSFQLIFNSSTKLNLGARYQLNGNMNRIAANNYFVSVETTFLNAFGRRKQ